MPPRVSPSETSLRDEWSWLAVSNRPIIFGPPSDRKVIHYSQQLTPAWPNISLASVILTFALNEAQTLQMPRHLPPTRAIADATQRIGPTAEDYRAMASYRTFLVADTSPSLPCDRTSILDCVDVLRSRVHDQDFARMAQVLDPRGDVFCSGISAYIPGTLSGLWEGTWMVSSNDSRSAFGLHRSRLASFAWFIGLVSGDAKLFMSTTDAMFLARAPVFHPQCSAVKW
jgi:hypothetical protein